MALTKPDCIERDAEKITAEMIAYYEAATGKTLYPVQAERLLIDLWAYREMLLRAAVRETPKQQQQIFLTFADDVMSDLRVELMLGNISENDKAKLAVWLNYKKFMKAVDVLVAPDIKLPAQLDVYIFYGIGLLTLYQYSLVSTQRK